MRTMDALWLLLSQYVFLVKTLTLWFLTYYDLLTPSFLFPETQSLPLKSPSCIIQFCTFRGRLGGWVVMALLLATFLKLGVIISKQPLPGFLCVCQFIMSASGNGGEKRGDCKGVHLSAILPFGWLLFDRKWC